MHALFEQQKTSDEGRRPPILKAWSSASTISSLLPPASSIPLIPIVTSRLDAPDLVIPTQHPSSPGVGWGGEAGQNFVGRDANSTSPMLEAGAAEMSFERAASPLAGVMAPIPRRSNLLRVAAAWAAIPVAQAPQTMLTVARPAPRMLDC
jgi:hypothetical protein